MKTLREYIDIVNEAQLVAPKFYITQHSSTAHPELGSEFVVTNLERGVEVATFDTEEEARAYVAQNDPAGAPQTELHAQQSHAAAPEREA